jgi:hypothetical protein
MHSIFPWPPLASKMADRLHLESWIAAAIVGATVISAYALVRGEGRPPTTTIQNEISPAKVQ